MKKSYLLCALAALAMLAASCQKDQDSISATIKNYQRYDKVYIDSDRYACWIAGDEVKLNGSTESITISGGSAKIAIGHGQTSPFYAIYPASVIAANGSATASTSVTLPSTQTYRVDANGNQVVEGVMAATGTTHLDFSNLCGLLKVVVPSGAYVKRIFVSCNKPLAGNGTVSFSGSTPTLTMADGGSTSVVMNVLATRNDNTYYVVVPPVANTAFKVTVYYRTANSSTGGWDHYTAILQQSGSNHLDANYIGTVNATLQSTQTEQLSGYYTINSNGDKVCFAPGNVQFQPSTASWRFAPRQYTIQGSANNNWGLVYWSGLNRRFNNTYTGWVDLFGWGIGNTPYHFEADSEDDADGEYGPFYADLTGDNYIYDWGKNFAPSGKWRTLTMSEWAYVLHHRTDGANKFVFATVMGVYGMALFPDNVTAADVATACNVNVINTSHTSPSNLVLSTEAQLLAFEDLGCAFLPAAGYRNDGASDFSNRYLHGMHYYNQFRYWTATNYSDATAITNRRKAIQLELFLRTGSGDNVWISHSDINAANDWFMMEQEYRKEACSVRLVCAAPSDLLQ